MIKSIYQIFKIIIYLVVIIILQKIKFYQLIFNKLLDIKLITKYKISLQIKKFASYPCI